MTTDEKLHLHATLLANGTLLAKREIEWRAKELAQAYLEGRLQSESAWIACKDRLPPDGMPVLAFIPDREYRRIAIGTVLQRDDGIVWEFNNNIAHEKLNDAGVFPSTKFTHWMLLPEVPHVER